jgi:EAL and modified HD-GYP domain-containing signal transduction protein
MKYEDGKNYDFFYVARQPILDRRGNTYGYELLFRAEEHESSAEFDNADFATMSVATCGFIISQESVDQSKRIFVNFTEHLIRGGFPRALPPTVTVVEILEDTSPSAEVLDEIIKLKQDGYLIALDDFVGDSNSSKFLDIADIIKVDVLGKTKEEIAAIFATLKDKKAFKLAEKVESGKDYNFLRDMGFDLFQGYFFARPENLTGKKIKATFSTKLRVLAALDDPTFDIDRIVDLINSDPSITYRLLRLLNSSAFGFSMKIASVRHSVILLGNTRMRYWLRMVVLSDLLADHKPGELLIMALNRGKILEELAIDCYIKDWKPETFFLFGMLSLLDVILDIPFSIIFTKLPLLDSFQEGYSDQSAPLAIYIRLLETLERADTQEMTDICHALGIKTSSVTQAAARANAWTDSIANVIL